MYGRDRSTSRSARKIRQRSPLGNRHSATRFQERLSPSRQQFSPRTYQDNREIYTEDPRRYSNISQTHGRQHQHAQNTTYVHRMNIQPEYEEYEPQYNLVRPRSRSPVYVKKSVVLHPSQTVRDPRQVVTHTVVNDGAQKWRPAEYQEGFRPPYAPSNVETGFSNVYKQQPSKVVETTYYKEEEPREVRRTYYENEARSELYNPNIPKYLNNEIEPTESDFNVDQTDLDEQTAYGHQRVHRRPQRGQRAGEQYEVIYEREEDPVNRYVHTHMTKKKAPPQQNYQIVSPRIEVQKKHHIDHFQPKEYRQEQVRQVQHQTQPRVVKRTTYVDVPPTEEYQEMPKYGRFSQEAYFQYQDENQTHITYDEWKQIQMKIDGEYERKLRQVSDEAMTKLKDYQEEHKQLIEKTQYMYEGSKRRGTEREVVEYVVEETPQPMDVSREYVKKTVEYLTPAFEPETTVYEDGFNDAYNIRVLRQEFQDIINHKMMMEGEVRLIDILEQFNLIDYNVIQDDYLYSFIKESQNNLVIKQENSLMQAEQDDIQHNLFKICCVVLAYGLQQRGHNYLEDKLLYSYLDQINTNAIDRDVLMIDQIGAIKSIINRKAFSLTDSECKLIASKFRNMRHLRQSQPRQYIEYKTTTEVLEPVPETPTATYVRGNATPSGFAPKYSLNPDVQHQQMVDRQILQGSAVRRTQGVYKQRKPAPQRQVYQVIEEEITPGYIQPDGQAEVYVPKRLRQPKGTIVETTTTKIPDPTHRETIVVKDVIVETQGGEILEQDHEEWIEPAKSKYLDVGYDQRHRSKSNNKIVVEDVEYYSEKPGYRYGNNQAGFRQVRQNPSRAFRQQNLGSHSMDRFTEPLGYTQTHNQPQHSFGKPAWLNRRATQRRSLSAQRGARRHQQSPGFRTNLSDNGGVYQARRSQVVTNTAGGNYQYKQPARPSHHIPYQNSGHFHTVKEKKKQFQNEPICILKIELDGGQKVEHIKIYEGQKPIYIANIFARKYNLSENAKMRLLDEINRQLDASGQHIY